MSDPDRALIDSFIAKHGVTKVPRGETGLLDENGNLKPGAFKWGNANRRRGRPRKTQPSPPPEPAPDVPARRANTERFAAAIEAKPARPAEPEAAEEPPAPRAAEKPAPASAKKERGRRGNLEEIREMVAKGWHVGMIAEALDRSEASIYVSLGRLGIKAAPKPRPQKAASSEPTKATPRRPGRNDAASVKKRERATDASERITDRRRFRTASVPMGEPAVQLASDHEAITEGQTYFPSRVFDASADDRVLIDGCNNSKIGGDVLVGWLKGARIVTLTLEERATCPRDCPIYRGCYGNAMQWARRWRHGPALERRIAAEVRQLCKAHERVLVRLHILGDFYSVQYVEFWRELLVEHPGLHVFGFTAWPEESEIGHAVALVRHTFPRRWWVRHSGRTGFWSSFTIDFPTSKKRIGDALVCPEQRDAMNGGAESRHCGNCAACWSSSVPIVFVEH